MYSHKTSRSDIITSFFLFYTLDDRIIQSDTV